MVYLHWLLPKFYDVFRIRSIFIYPPMLVNIFMFKHISLYLMKIDKTMERGCLELHLHLFIKCLRRFLDLQSHQILREKEPKHRTSVN